MKPILKHTNTLSPDMEYHSPKGVTFQTHDPVVIAPPVIAMDLNAEVKPLIEKPPVDKCTWSFFKTCCSEALKETCDDMCNNPHEDAFVNQRVNFLPHIP